MLEQLANCAIVLTFIKHGLFCSVVLFEVNIRNQVNKLDFLGFKQGNIFDEMRNFEVLLLDFNVL